MNSGNMENNRQSHTLTLRARKLLEMRGVTDVTSFDEETVELSTTDGMLMVEGDGLHIKVLNLAEGIVSLEGNVTAMTYSEKNPMEKGTARGFFGKRGR